ncbi:hypothetical protein M1203_00510 [Streptomyces sp. 35G-GA-8]|nr:TetR family transcriptional regulator C-terminal domain-containing protein [Streptomyces sp. 35G-GA-8]MCL7375339.1 hypothetical protein [Streptomyces sp. 35G-GA-8]
MATVRLSVAERREDPLRGAVGQIEARGVAAVRMPEVAAVLGGADPVSAASRLTAMLDGLAVQMTSHEGSLPRATMLEWTDAAPARELGLDSAAFGMSGPETQPDRRTDGQTDRRPDRQMDSSTDTGRQTPASGGGKGDRGPAADRPAPS